MPSVHRRVAQSSHVENEHDLLVAELGRARNPRHLHQRVADTAHHYLSLSEYSVNGYAERRSSAAYHEDVEGTLAPILQIEEVRESHERCRVLTNRLHLLRDEVLACA